MATALILDELNNKTISISLAGYAVVEVEELTRNILVLDKLNNKTERIFPIDYPIIEVEPLERTVSITEVLPFRIKFSAIQIQAIGLGNTPAIPLQVIGYSNYIL